MKKVEIILKEGLEEEIIKIVKLKSNGNYVAREEDIILRVLELYTSRYKNMVEGSITSIENAVRQK